MDDKDLSYWLARIKDCKYEPDKIHIYCEHAQQACNKMFQSKDAEIKKLRDGIDKIFEKLNKRIIIKELSKFSSGKDRYSLAYQDARFTVDKILETLKQELKEGN